MAGERCPKSGKRIRVADHLRGKFVRCSNSAASFVAGMPDAPTVELKEAGADRWEKIKEGVGSALDDLKKVFE